MEYISYIELLKDPRWQKKRLEILQRDNFTCQICPRTKTKSTLQVHHKKYIKGKNPWEYENEDLITVCEQCHEIITNYKNINFFNCVLFSFRLLPNARKFIEYNFFDKSKNNIYIIIFMENNIYLSTLKLTILNKLITHGKN